MNLINMSKLEKGSLVVLSKLNNVKHSGYLDRKTAYRSNHPLIIKSIKTKVVNEGFDLDEEGRYSRSRKVNELYFELYSPHLNIVIGTVKSDCVTTIKESDLTRRCSTWFVVIHTFHTIKYLNSNIQFYYVIRPYSIVLTLRNSSNVVHEVKCNIESDIESSEYPDELLLLL